MALTVFTPTYNRKHTLVRTFDSLCRQTSDIFEWLIIDDGSSDDTRDWVEGLGEKIVQEGDRFDWMGRRIEGKDSNHFLIKVLRPEGRTPLHIHYVKKENGGLYTGYNVAYALIETELCVCIDSDDFMPDDAVERILKCWADRPKKKVYGGIVGLDFSVVDGKPIGGFFPPDLSECWQLELGLHHIHVGDTKEVLRTDLMKKVAPMIGFKGEKHFNPWYMVKQVVDEYPMLVINGNLCWVDYQIGKDSMSQAIWKQYLDSPRSFAKHRIMWMQMRHNTWKNKFKNCVHYVSSCILAKDKDWFKNTPLRGMTMLAVPFGIALTVLVLWKNRKLK